MLNASVLLAASLLMVLAASALFTNGIEQVGRRLKMHQGAVGSILAAIGTALPETVIPIIAIVLIRDEQAVHVAIGAIAGAPFMLATLALCLTGLAAIVFSLLGRSTLPMALSLSKGRRPTAITVAPKGLERDLTFFIGLYGAAVLATFIHGRPLARAVVALALLGSYAIYLRKTITADGAALELPRNFG